MTHPLRRFSSRRQPLGKSFLCQRLRNAESYDRIAGYFCSSLLEIAGEEIESVSGKVRMVCNSDLSPDDVSTARAANLAVRKSWCAFNPEKLLEGGAAPKLRERYRLLFELLKSGKLEVRVLPDEVFGLIHGKAGIISLENGLKTSFMGSANESKSAWKLNWTAVSAAKRGGSHVAKVNWRPAPHTHKGWLPPHACQRSAAWLPTTTPTSVSVGG